MAGFAEDLEIGVASADVFAEEFALAERWVCGGDDRLKEFVSVEVAV